MKYIKKFENWEGSGIGYPDQPNKVNGVLDYYNSKKQHEVWEFLEQNNDEDDFIDLFGDENGKIRCSLEDGLNGLKNYGKWSREEIELFAKNVREFGI